MAEDIRVSVVESEPFYVQMSELQTIAVQIAGVHRTIVQSVESEKIAVALSEPEPINVSIIGGTLGHGIASPITDHGDVESLNQKKNDLLLFNSAKKKYENKQVLSFDQTTDEVIIGLN